MLLTAGPKKELSLQCKSAMEEVGFDPAGYKNFGRLLGVYSTALYVEDSVQGGATKTLLLSTYDKKQVESLL